MVSLIQKETYKNGEKRAVDSHRLSEIFSIKISQAKVLSALRFTRHKERKRFYKYIR